MKINTFTLGNQIQFASKPSNSNATLNISNTNTKPLAFQSAKDNLGIRAFGSEKFNKAGKINNLEQKIQELKQSLEQKHSIDVGRLEYLIKGFEFESNSMNCLSYEDPLIKEYFQTILLSVTSSDRKEAKNFQAFIHKYATLIEQQVQLNRLNNNTPIDPIDIHTGIEDSIDLKHMSKSFEALHAYMTLQNFDNHIKANVSSSEELRYSRPQDIDQISKISDASTSQIVKLIDEFYKMQPYLKSFDSDIITTALTLQTSSQVDDLSFAELTDAKDALENNTALDKLTLNKINNYVLSTYRVLNKEHQYLYALLKLNDNSELKRYSDDHIVDMTLQYNGLYVSLEKHNQYYNFQEQLDYNNKHITIHDPQMRDFLLSSCVNYLLDHTKQNEGILGPLESMSNAVYIVKSPLRTPHLKSEITKIKDNLEKKYPGALSMVDSFFQDLLTEPGSKYIDKYWDADKITQFVSLLDKAHDKDSITHFLKDYMELIKVQKEESDYRKSPLDVLTISRFVDMCILIPGIESVGTKDTSFKNNNIQSVIDARREFYEFLSTL